MRWKMERSRDVPMGGECVPLPSEGRGHKFESCRARQWINGLARDRRLIELRLATL